MPYKIQHTAANLHQKMSTRYGDGLHHKHNKDHLHYRQHWRSHPCQPRNNLIDEEHFTGSTGLLRQYKLRKMCTRPNKRGFH